MGCLDKVGGTIIALIIIIVGICFFAAPGGWPLAVSLIIGGIVFGIMTFAIDYEDFMSFTDALTESPLSGLMFKYFIDTVVSGIVVFVLTVILGVLSS